MFSGRLYRGQFDLSKLTTDEFELSKNSNYRGSNYRESTVCGFAPNSRQPHVSINIYFKLNSVGVKPNRVLGPKKRLD